MQGWIGGIILIERGGIVFHYNLRRNIWNHVQGMEDSKINTKLLAQKYTKIPHSYMPHPWQKYWFNGPKHVLHSKMTDIWMIKRVCITHFPYSIRNPCSRTTSYLDTLIRQLFLFLVIFKFSLLLKKKLNVFEPRPLIMRQATYPLYKLFHSYKTFTE